jgi:hypothetical protein
MECLAGTDAPTERLGDFNCCFTASSFLNTILWPEATKKQVDSEKAAHNRLQQFLREPDCCDLTKDAIQRTIIGEQIVGGTW